MSSHSKKKSLAEKGICNARREEKYKLFQKRKQTKKSHHPTVTFPQIIYIRDLNVKSTPHWLLK